MTWLLIKLDEKKGCTKFARSRRPRRGRQQLPLGGSPDKKKPCLGSPIVVGR